RMSRTLIEDLSNEFFYEIFEYLDSYEIYQAFFDLNNRFQQLLNSSYLLFKIRHCYSQSKEIIMNKYKQIFLHNKNQIFSVHLWILPDNNQFISSFTIDSSFIRLESLVFRPIEPDLLISLLPKLIYLPRLFSLTIDTWSALKDLGNIYQLIFNLRKLKYIKYKATESDNFDITVSLSIATNEQQVSTIEYLIIDHPCAYNELYNIISYTPQLRRLKFLNLSESNISIEVIKPMTLSNLTHLSINNYQMTFDEFEIFIKKLYSSKLKVLSFTTIVQDIAYLDANRWEEFILQNLPKLEEFYFKYSTYFEDHYETPMYSGKRDQFISPFWIERRWILQAEIELDNLIYSIRPYKKRWYEYNTQHKMINSCDQLSKFMRLILVNKSSEGWPNSLAINKYISHVLTVTQIHHMETQEHFFIGKLREILDLLSELDSLQIYSLSFSQSTCLSREEIENLLFLSTKNQITKLCLEIIILIEEVYFLIEIFPRINHLQVNFIHSMDVELFVRLILIQIKIKSNHPLRLLCFCVAAADDEMVHKLEKMINIENLLVDFTVKHVMNEIYLQWK
ncbi:unnamed protein product, partial [Rotaria sp. Silwood2]